MDYITLFQTLAYIALYAIIGFGPGVLLGIVTANIIGARGKASTTDKYQTNLKSAATHNAQWHPSHNKWHEK